MRNIKASISGMRAGPGFGAGLAVLLAGTAAPAFAQAAGDSNFGDIVVTARKQAETVLEVPIAVSTMTSAELTDRQVSSASDLAQFTPGLTMNQSFGRSGDRPIIRGSSNILFSEGKVGIFLDGIPFFGDFSSIDLAGASGWK